jgi:phenylacetate-CoA ligase
MKPEVKWSRREAVAAMLGHAANHAPFYRTQAWAERLRARETVAFRDIPITAKALVRDRTAEFFGSFVPPAHGEVVVRPTSGSTGEPMEVRKTLRHFAINALENQRLKRGWGFDGHKRTVHVSVPLADHPAGEIEEEDAPDGGHSWKIYTSESRVVFDLLRRTSPSLVWSSPSMIRAALELCREASETVPLKLISTVAEVMPEELREMVRQIPGCRLVDMYGTVETGLIAGQCPLCDAYHPADRHLILELITEDGRRPEPGEMGRVIVTPLFNRAMPLIRYETGDYAEPAPANGCPRSSFAIRRILGRERNLFKMPDGSKIMPKLPHSVVHDLALRGFKLIQRTLTNIELLYVPRDDTVEIAEDVAQALIDRYMAPGFKVRCFKVAELPRAPSGKFLMHECLI